jgi:hypothetical protein
MTQAKITHDRRPGSPYDRGSADRYYDRVAIPHYYRDGTPLTRVEAKDMTPDELADYHAGYDQESDRKQWAQGEA